MSNDKQFLFIYIYMVRFLPVVVCWPDSHFRASWHTFYLSDLGWISYMCIGIITLWPSYVAHQLNAALDQKHNSALIKLEFVMFMSRIRCGNSSKVKKKGPCSTPQNEEEVQVIWFHGLCRTGHISVWKKHYDLSHGGKIEEIFNWAGWPQLSSTAIHVFKTKLKQACRTNVQIKVSYSWTN